MCRRGVLRTWWFLSAHYKTCNFTISWQTRISGNMAAVTSAPLRRAPFDYCAWFCRDEPVDQHMAYAFMNEYFTKLPTEVKVQIWEAKHFMEWLDYYGFDCENCGKLGSVDVKCRFCDEFRCKACARPGSICGICRSFACNNCVAACCGCERIVCRGHYCVDGDGRPWCHDCVYDDVADDEDSSYHGSDDEDSLDDVPISWMYVVDTIFSGIGGAYSRDDMIILLANYFIVISELAQSGYTYVALHVLLELNQNIKLIRIFNFPQYVDFTGSQLLHYFEACSDWLDVRLPGDRNEEVAKAASKGLLQGFINPGAPFAQFLDVNPEYRERIDMAVIVDEDDGQL